MEDSSVIEEHYPGDTIFTIIIMTLSLSQDRSEIERMEIEQRLEALKRRVSRLETLCSKPESAEKKRTYAHPL